MDALLSGKLSGATATQKIVNATLPMTITFNSSNASRKIELSTDEGVSYFSPASYEVTTASQLVVVVTAKITDVKFTGAANDTWSIL